MLNALISELDIIPIFDALEVFFHLEPEAQPNETCDLPSSVKPSCMPMRSKGI